MLTVRGATRILLATASLACGVPATDTFVYVGRVGETSATIAWGTTNGKGNTIGRGSKPLGPATVRIDGRELKVSGKNFIDVTGLAADSSYGYTVTAGGADLAGALRTWPTRSEKLTFFLIGDYGKGDSEQESLGRRMKAELKKTFETGPPRFILTTGDNIYGKQLGFGTFSSGNRDSHWKSRFFEPYQEILKSIPFYPTPGNHDGDESENRDDMDVYLDNFFFPVGEPARYYQFSYGGYADFFGLDSTENTGSDASPSGAQSQWLAKALAASRASWKIVYMHHPPYTAGPRHEPSLERLRHWVELFRKYGVQVVFTGHEHNFQYARQDGITYFVSGAGGALRDGDITGRLKESGIQAWSAERHFLAVEMDGDLMKVTPVGDAGPIGPRDAAGSPVGIPLTVRRAQ